MALSCHFGKGSALQGDAIKPFHAKSRQVIRGNVCHWRKGARTAGAEWPMAARPAHALAVPATVIQAERKSNEAMGIDPQGSDSRNKILLQQEAKTEEIKSVRYTLCREVSEIPCSFLYLVWVQKEKGRWLLWIGEGKATQSGCNSGNGRRHTCKNNYMPAKHRATPEQQDTTPACLLLCSSITPRM